MGRTRRWIAWGSRAVLGPQRPRLAPADPDVSHDYSGISGSTSCASCVSDSCQPR